MTFREKSAWVCLLITIAVFGPYFTYIVRLYSQEPEAATPRMIVALIVAVIAYAVMTIVAHIAIAIRSSKEQSDERDAAISAKSVRNAYGVLLLFVGALIFTPGPWGELRTVSFMMQLLLLCFVAAETTRFLTQVVCYRRGS